MSKPPPLLGMLRDDGLWKFKVGVSLCWFFRRMVVEVDSALDGRRQRDT